MTYATEERVRDGVTRGDLAVGVGGSTTESMGGVAVIVLAILALARIAPVVLAPIAGIVFGVAFLIEGGAIAAMHTRLVRAAARSEMEQLELGGGVTVEVLTGLACAVLGILALLGVSSTVMLPALVIVGGAGLALSAGAVQQLNNLRAQIFNISADVQNIARMAVGGAAAAQMMAGAGAVTLGIIALVRGGVYPTVLAMVGLLVLGVSITLSGAALSGKLMRLFRRA